MPKGTRLSSSVDVGKQKRTTAQLRAQYERVAKAANKRLEKLREAGYEKSEFVRNHRKGFKEDVSRDQYGRVYTRQQISKMLAEVNRFMNAESSTVRGMKKTRQNILDALHAPDGEGKPTRYAGITEENLDRFTRFMEMYDNQVRKQTDVGSDTVVEAFLMSERLRIKPEDLIHNMDRFDEYEEMLAEMSVEDLVGDLPVGNRKFTLDDYIRAGELQND